MKTAVAYLSLALILLPVGVSAESGSRISRNEYILQWKDEAIYQMVLHKIPASITIAQGILESADGNSRLAKEANNHFGIKCHSDWKGGRTYHDDDKKGECFRVYNHARESYEDHSLFLMKPRYAPLFEEKLTDYKAWAKGLKKAGYATNNQYADLLIRIIEENNLTEFDDEGEKYIRKGEVPSGRAAAPEPVAVKEKQNKNKGKKHDSDIQSEVNLAANRSIKVSDNNIKFIVAKNGDSIESICSELDMMPWQLRKYNDLEGKSTFTESEVIYLQPKRNKSKRSEFHVVKEGEDLWSISQHYGVKLKKLRKLNSIESNNVTPGSRVKLR